MLLSSKCRVSLDWSTFDQGAWLFYIHHCRSGLCWCSDKLFLIHQSLGLQPSGMHAISSFHNWIGIWMQGILSLDFHSRDVVVHLRHIVVATMTFWILYTCCHFHVTSACEIFWGSKLCRTIWDFHF